MCGSGRWRRSPHGTAESGRSHRSRRSGGVFLEGVRDGRGMGRESTGASRSALKNQTDQSRPGGACPVPCRSRCRFTARATRRRDAGRSTAGSRQRADSERYVRVSNAWCHRAERAVRPLLACPVPLARTVSKNRGGLARARLAPQPCGPPSPCRFARDGWSVPFGGVTEETS